MSTSGSPPDTRALPDQHGPGEVPPPPETQTRRAVVWLAVAALLATAVVGANLGGLRDRLLGTATPPPAPPAAGRVVGQVPLDGPAAPTALRSSPWWQEVAQEEGTGPASSGEFTIAEESIQWRVEASCEGSNVAVAVAGSGEPILSGPCDEVVMGYATDVGPARLDIEADGPWRLEVDQQIDAPLSEPPLAAMTAPEATVVASGEFYDIDNTATGTVDIYRLADGGSALRLEDFFVTPNVDLEIRLSTLEAPRTTEEFLSAPNELVAVMDATAGSLNYAVAPGVDLTQYRSLVIWCAPIDSAYAAASLGGGP